MRVTAINPNLVDLEPLPDELAITSPEHMPHGSAFTKAGMHACAAGLSRMTLSPFNAERLMCESGTAMQETVGAEARPRRPGYGSVGRKVIIRANHYHVACTLAQARPSIHPSLSPTPEPQLLRVPACTPGRLLSVCMS